MPEPKFLVVRLGSLGDIVHAFPAVAALRETFPRSQIVWLTHPRWHGLVASASLATEIWDVETRSFSSVVEMRARIRREQFSTALDYQGLWKSAALPFFARVPQRIGFSSESVREFGVPMLYTERVQVHSAHVADKNGELSLRAGAAKPVGRFSLGAPADAQQRVCDILKGRDIGNYFVLSPGGGWLSKCWPTERYGQLAQRLRGEYGMRSVINYGPGEKTLADGVLAAAGDAAPFPYSGSFGELMALLQGARCVIAGDTGPMHLADALGTKVIAIFGPTDPERNGPYSGKGIILRAPGVEPTYKRHDAPHPSLLEIGVGDVLDALCKAQVLP
ncbi:MAG TPA: glycosyltransferase family 9 protein [Candidatus Sulfotelmatobacter sp.]|jgi:heptosyltransferase-1|nr:glycosyltransferase family 9 protein [Candidatus Sulfotelmatobacter sp.]